MVNNLADSSFNKILIECESIVQRNTTHTQTISTEESVQVMGRIVNICKHI